jgi:hypothetical protein
MSSYKVWRDTPQGREIVISNFKNPGEVEATEQEYADWCAEKAKPGQRNDLIEELKALDIKYIRALREGGNKPADWPATGTPEMPWVDWWASETIRVRQLLSDIG